jgi:SAM-dependent methyltransferase
MERRKWLLEGIDRSMLGIEVAPWLVPLVPKAEGYNVRVLDVFDQDQLLARAKADPLQAGRDLSRLELVDFVGSATEIAELVPRELHGSFDYIVSSHNFEHLPDPIRFLQGCRTVLREGGILAMAVPDHRGCFDYFREPTSIGDWLDAHVERRLRPTPRQVFDTSSRMARYHSSEGDQIAFHVGVPPTDVGVVSAFEALYRTWYGSTRSGDYIDAHCTVMTPASLALMLLEVRQLGLIEATVEAMTEPMGCEFLVRLRFGSGEQRLETGAFEQERIDLLRRMGDEQAAKLSPVLPRPGKSWLRRMTMPVARGVRSAGRRLRGRDD